MLNIKEDRLQEILDLRKKYIKSVGDIVIVILTIAGYFVTLLTSDWKSKPLFFQILIGVATVIIVISSIISILNSFYSVDQLRADIESVSEKNHNFSLIIIKDNSGKFVKHYLVKKDRRWKCFLFPYYRTSDSDKEDFNNLLTDIGFSNISFGKILEQNLTKKSYSAGHSKDYHHKYYEIFVDCSDKKIKKKFKHNGVKYYWLTAEDMKADKNTKIRNSDVIHFIEDNM